MRKPFPNNFTLSVYSRQIYTFLCKFVTLKRHLVFYISYCCVMRASNNILSRFLCGVAALAALVSCSGKSDEKGESDSRFADYIEAYTGGLVYSTSTVRIQFSSTPDSSVPAEDLFSFSPSLKGEARWVSPNLVEYVPESGALKPKQRYKVKFAMGKVFDIKDKSLNVFEFGFNVAPKEAAVEIQNVKISEGEPDVAVVCGTISFSEAVYAGEVQKHFKVNGADDESEVTFSDSDISGAGSVYGFSIYPVARKDKDRTVSVSFDGKGMKISDNGVQKVTVPAKGEFKVLSARLVEAKEPCVEVQFTEPLERVVDRSGLYAVDGASASYSKIEDNILRIYLENVGCHISVNVFGGIRSCAGDRLGDTFSVKFTVGDIPPQVIFPLSGNILPDPDHAVIPFRAVCLNAVDVKVIQIYKNNILTFLQENDLDGDVELRRSGRLVYKTTLRLDSNPETDLHKWNDYLLDMGGMFKNDKSAIYRVVLSFRQDYSLYGKASMAGQTSSSSEPEMIKLRADDSLSDADNAVWDEPSTYFYDDYFDWNIYKWSDSDNPLTPSYYMLSSRFPAVNLLSSDIGLTVKQADNGCMWVNVNNLLTAKPMSDVEIDVYNYQLQKIASAKSDADGFAEMALKHKAFVVVAKSKHSTTYLKVTDGSQNSLSRFDTGGVKIQKGLKGFVYGERGVWRPGDTLHLTLLVDSKSAGLPDNHPAKMELYTPQGQLRTSLVCPGSVNGFYRFDVPTDEGDPTGIWNSYFKIGGTSFHKALHIETVKPNRLKITLNPDTDVLESGKSYNMGIASEWLSGSSASGLKVSTEMSLRNAKTEFKSFENYRFTNPLVEFEENTGTIIKGTLDANGKLSANVVMPLADNAPGMLKAVMVSRVEEPGGGESIVSSEVRFSPFNGYVGVRFPSDDDSYLETDKDNEFRVAVVDCNGRRLGGHRIEYMILKLSWNWWWEANPSRLASYVASTSPNVVSSGEFVSSGSSDSVIGFRVNYPDWGGYLLIVRDEVSGHISGGQFFCDWPSWRGRADRNGADAADMLMFNLDRKSYKVGDEATVFIPVAEDGMALVSYENGSGVIAREWVKTKDTELAHKFKVTEEMSPNSYVHITLYQPYSSTGHGHIIRMYGVQPFLVSNPSSHLEPVLTLPDVVRPQKEFSVKVKESKGRRMTYTLAVVDEGVLGLTGYRTPEPWDAMNARQSLGVSTWDMYSKVVGASVADISSMFSIGGDEGGIRHDTERDRRFNPVVKFYGPFTLERGEKTHKITLPMYIGAVRVMIVAGQDGAYGSASKTVPVRNPLMVMSTAPRILGTDEEFELPVNVFVMEDGISNVRLSLATDGPVAVTSDRSSAVSFSEKGDKLVRFKLRTSGSEGEIKLKLKASSGSYSAEETVSIEVRNPNPPVLKLSRAAIPSGAEVVLDCPIFSGNGIATASRGSASSAAVSASSVGVSTSATGVSTSSTGGSASSVNVSDSSARGRNYYGDTANLEITAFPAMSFKGLLSYAGDYQYLCTEQLSARGIALVSILPMLSDKVQSDAAGAKSKTGLANSNAAGSGKNGSVNGTGGQIKSNSGSWSDRAKAESIISELLKQLSLRQLPDGCFCFWPGSANVNLWGSTMAGHFMALASINGIPVSKSMFNAWKNRELRAVKAYHSGVSSNGYSDAQQAYSLYVLALAGAPESSAMNRLKSSTSLSPLAANFLASAYVHSGKKAVAEQIVNAADPQTANSSVSSEPFGSSLRDEAVAMETMLLLNNMTCALPLAERVAEAIKDEMFTTQTAAFAAVAVSRLYSLVGNSAVDAEVTFGGTTCKLCSASSVASMELYGNVTNAAGSNAAANAAGPNAYPNMSGPNAATNAAGYQSVKVKNNSPGTVYATLVSRYTAKNGEALPASSSGIGLSVRYRDADGRHLDPSALQQGTEFYADITVSNLNAALDLSDLALTMRIPSGWEIFNDRLFDRAETSSVYSYLDIRDDRAVWYFDLKKTASKVFTLRLTASYLGNFSRPQVVCEAMYDNSIFAATASGRAKVL